MYSIILILSEAADGNSKGGLFDFNATLPLMALQFIGLTLVLNLLYYKPVINILDDREEYIRSSLTSASASLVKADELTKTYELELAESRKSAQMIIKNAQEQAQLIVSDKLKDAQKNAENLLVDAYNQLSQQKQQALKSLEVQVDVLSDQIQNKLLNNY
uniref:ATP synthase subunit b', chloroplastic n=1 Tax=Kapraunia schneideri TaxID=717899 RepID=A0A1Z1MT16_9FLOR|nr:ATP synthase CF0 subunit II [Kapraunia schneideri]ARW68905.1 ATP synthase CF0 subunit II [Kapraunia schneideri]